MDNKHSLLIKKEFYNHLMLICLILAPILLVSAVVLMILGQFQIIMLILVVMFLTSSTLCVYFAKESKKYDIKYKKYVYLNYANSNDLAFSRIIRAYDSKLFIKELQKMKFDRLQHSIDTSNDKILITISATYEDYFILLELDEEEFGFNMSKLEINQLTYYKYDEFISKDELNQSFKLICDKISQIINEKEAELMDVTL